MDDRKSRIHEEFVQKFGAQPDVWANAPGRVDLMGSHTDYNHGFVLTMSIAYDTWIAASKRDDGEVLIASANTHTASQFNLTNIAYDPKTPWSNYVRGVAKMLQDEKIELSGFDGLVHSTVPMASGLSSSAALEVATARLFVALSELVLDPVQLALICQRAENQFVGMNCGILDQYTSSVCPVGQALLLDCRHLSHTLVQIPNSIQVIICDTKAKRELTGSEYPERRAACEVVAARFAQWYPEVTHLRDVSLDQFCAHMQDFDERAARRARFILEENQRVLDLAPAIAIGDKPLIEELFETSYRGARDLYEIISPEMEKMQKAMLAAPGVIGARQAGAGFGGCMVAVVETGSENEFSLAVKKSYQGLTGLEAGIYLA